jgi:uncharacterized protein
MDSFKQKLKNSDMTKKLPKTIPVFPLYGCILLPKTILPLNIFEPRYRQMIEHAVEGEGLIGIIQPLNNEDHGIHKIGCLGRIEYHQKNSDGTFLVRLQGETRFEIFKELEVDTLYRQVEVEYNRFKSDATESLEEEKTSDLLQAFKGYASRKELQVEWEKIESIPLNLLVNILSINLDFNSIEKQALLEAPSLIERWDHLIALLYMASLEDVSNSSNFLN